MKSWKKAAALAAGAVMLSGSLNVSAAGVRDVFDAQYYADSYEDLKETFGNDTDALLWHYMTYGLNEGRSGSRVFDVAEYRSAYGDLNEAFGDDWDAYVNHYCTYGITEGRTAGVYGEIDLSRDNSSDAAENTEEHADDVDYLYLHKGESVDIAYSVEGIEGLVHAKVTLTDVTHEPNVWQDVIMDGNETAGAYSYYTCSLLVEYDPSVDWHVYDHDFVYGMNDEIDYISDYTKLEQGLGWLFTADMGRISYVRCLFSAGWDAFDYDNSSQMIYYEFRMPLVQIHSGITEVLYPTFQIVGATEKIGLIFD